MFHQFPAGLLLLDPSQPVVEELTPIHPNHPINPDEISGIYTHWLVDWNIFFHILGIIIPID